LPGPAYVAQLGRALDETQEPHEVARILGAAKTAERGVHHLASLRRQPVGVVLDTKPLAATSQAVQHVAEILARRLALPVVPDPHVFDDRRDARLAEIGRARAEGERAVRPQVHTPDHAVAAG